jgi:hypothetical protein
VEIQMGSIFEVLISTFITLIRKEENATIGDLFSPMALCTMLIRLSTKS